MQRLLGLLLITGLLFGCNKKDPDAPSFGESLSFSFKLDGVPYSIALPVNQPDTTVRVFTGIPDNPAEKQSGVVFKFNDSYFRLIMGFAYDSTQTESETFRKKLLLTAPGLKEYDYLEGGHPGVTEKVELELFENGRYWNSTKQIFDSTGRSHPDSLYKSRIVDQPGSLFEVTSQRQYYLSRERRNAIIIKANFSCILYEGNGDRKRILTEGRITYMD